MGSFEFGNKTSEQKNVLLLSIWFQRWMLHCFALIRQNSVRAQTTIAQLWNNSHFSANKKLWTKNMDRWLNDSDKWVDCGRLFQPVAAQSGIFASRRWSAIADYFAVPYVAKRLLSNRIEVYRVRIAAKTSFPAISGKDNQRNLDSCGIAFGWRKIIALSNVVI